jgi:phage tail sheath protein FI
MELFNEPIIQKKTLSDVIKNDNVMTNTTMVGGSFNGGKITIGSGNNIFTANKDGIFLGSSSFDTAPFSVNMLGDVIANSIIITGGSLDGTTTIGGRLCSTVAEAIDANGHFIDDRFDTDSKTILSDFTFGTSGALQIGTYSEWC